MKRLRLLLFSVFAVLAMSIVGTIGAGSASAAPCAPEVTSGNFALCVESSLGSGVLELIEQSVEFLNFKETKTKSVLEVPALGAKIECFQAKSTGRFVPTTKSVTVTGLTITFENGCHVIGAESVCTVTEPITTLPISSNGITLVEITLGSTTLVTDILFRPTSGTLFSTVHVLGEGCEGKGTIFVAGEQLCEAPEIEEDSIEQLLFCPLFGSELLNGTKEAKFELSELIDLHPPFEGDKWSIIQGK